MKASNPYEGSQVRYVSCQFISLVWIGVGLERVVFRLLTGVSLQVVILLSVPQSRDHLINAISLGRGTKRQLLERPSRPLPEGRTGSRGFSPTMKLHPAVAHTL